MDNIILDLQIKTENSVDIASIRWSISLAQFFKICVENNHRRQRYNDEDTMWSSFPNRKV